jgi:hypothetical protein
MALVNMSFRVLLAPPKLRSFPMFSGNLSYILEIDNAEAVQSGPIADISVRRKYTGKY